MKREEIEALADTAKRNLLAAVQDAATAGGNGGQHRTVAAEWTMVFMGLRGIAQETPRDEPPFEQGRGYANEPDFMADAEGRN